MDVKLTYNAVDYKALLKTAVLCLDEMDEAIVKAYFKPEEMKILEQLLEEVYDERYHD